MSKKKKRADYDSPWKEILEAYFQQAIEFFFPNTASDIDWQAPIEFLDKEFQAISSSYSLRSREVAINSC